MVNDKYTKLFVVVVGIILTMRTDRDCLCPPFNELHRKKKKIPLRERTIESQWWVVCVIK